MAKLTYSEQLRHPNWQRKRLEALEASCFQCDNCGDKETTLNVHHRRYVKGRMAWDYELNELAVLCEPCHESEHQARSLLDWVIAEAGCSSSVVAALLSGFFDATCSIDRGVAEMGRQTDQRFYEIGVAAAVLDSADVDAWRALIRDYATRSPVVSPTVLALIDRWNESDQAS